MSEPGASDWPAETADRIDALVTGIRDKTVVPLTTVARGLVYGLIAGVMGSAVVILLAVGAVRAIDNYLPGEVWSAHLVVGMFFTLAGLYFWSKRRSREN